MESFNIHAAKTNLSKLIERVERGEEIIISRDGKPVAKLSPTDNGQIAPKKRMGGQWTGKVRYAPDYDEADAIIQKMFDDSINAAD